MYITPKSRTKVHNNYLLTPPRTQEELGEKSRAKRDPGEKYLYPEGKSETLQEVQKRLRKVRNP